MEHQRTSFDKGVTEAELSALREVLARKGWQKRKDLCAELQWPERKVREVANAGGREFLRGPKGFNLTSKCTADEITECANRFRKQITEMTGIEVGWRQIAHGKVG